MTRKGRLHVTSPAHHAVAWGTLSGLFWGVLIGLIFLFPLAPLAGVAGGIMGAALGAAGNLGVKDDFRQRVQDLVAARDVSDPGHRPQGDPRQVPGGHAALRRHGAEDLAAARRRAAAHEGPARGRPSGAQLAAACLGRGAGLKGRIAVLDRAAARRAAAPAAGPRARMPRLSRLADHGLLWTGLAIGLWVPGTNGRGGLPGAASAA